MPFKSKEAQRAYQREYMRKRRENKELREAELELLRKQRDSDEYRARDAKWKRDNRDKVRAYEQQYYKENSAKVIAKVSKRRAKQVSATFGDQEAINFVYHAAQAIKDVYGTQWEVDHVVPLQGNNVSGLHIACNLQLLSPEQNRSKSNQWQDY